MVTVKHSDVLPDGICKSVSSFLISKLKIRINGFKNLQTLTQEFYLQES